MLRIHNLLFVLIFYIVLLAQQRLLQPKLLQPKAWLVVHLFIQRLIHIHHVVSELLLLLPQIDAQFVSSPVLIPQHYLVPHCPQHSAGYYPDSIAEGVCLVHHVSGQEH